MESRVFLLAVLIPFLILVALLFMNSVHTNFLPNVLADNATQAPSRINITLYVKTCNGATLKEGSRLPDVSVIYNGSTVFSSKCTTCKILNVSEGVYLVKVNWRGKLVYEKNLTFTASNSTAEILTRTTSFVATVLNDNEEPITYRVSVKIYGNGISLSPEPGEALIIPFGDYTVEASYSWTCKIVVKKIVKVHVNCSETGVKVVLPVASEVTLKFVRPDGTRALGINGNATIYASNGKKAESIDLKKRDAITFTNMPYGTYRVVVTLRDKKVIDESFTVKSGGKRVFTYTIPIINSVKLVFLDADNNPVPLLPVIVETPLGDELKLGTNNAGEVTISQALIGEYVITATWQGVSIRKTVKITSEAATITLPLRKTTLIVKPKASYALPKGLRLKVVLQRTGYVVKEDVLPQEKAQWTVNLGFLLTNSRYEATIEYLNTTWSNTYTPSSGGSWIIEVPLYDVSIRVTTLTGDTLIGCNFTAKYDGVTRIFKLTGGGIVLKQLPNVDVAITVSCNGVPVYQGSIHPSRLANGSTTLKAYVTDVKLHVKGWFNKPLEGANITLVVLSANHKLRFTSLSDSNGYVVFRNIPVPPGSSIKAFIKYKNQALSLIVDPTKNVENVFLDVFLDTPLGALSLETTILVSAALSVSSLVAAILYKRYKYVKDIEGLLVPEDYWDLEEGYGRRGAFKEEGALEKIKEFIKELLGKGEEEEGETFFG